MSKAAPNTITKVAVIGAGNMGSGIAQKAATEGFEVLLVDLDASAVARGMKRIEDTLAEGVARKIFKPEAAAAIKARISPSADLAAAAGADLVIEAVFEDLEVKREVFRRLDAACAPSVILATNTSSFRVQDIASAVRHPERVMGLHYFFHPAKNRLVEVVPHAGSGGGSSPELREAAWAFNERLGKTPIGSKDAPGFVVNRFFVPWINEAVRVRDEGIADIPTIDEAAKQAWGVGMGPFALMNATGIPIGFHAATTLGRSLGAFYEPAKGLEEQFKAGKPFELAGPADPSRFDAVNRRLAGAALLAAGQLVDERVSTLEDTDLGARVGLRWLKGPFELANEWTIAESIRRIEPLAKAWDLRVPRVFLEREGRPFRFERVRLAVEDGIATITIRRPDAQNALNEEVVAQLREAWDKASGDPAVKALVLAGAGKSFVAGADIKFFIDALDRGDLGRIRGFTEAGQALFRRIDESPKPVTVRLDGLSLGGGSELAICADRIVATDRGSLGFPETGIGIYPGLGGTQRLPRRIGKGLAKYYILTGQTITVADAVALGLAERVDPAALQTELRIVPPLHSWLAPPPAPPAGLAKAAAFFDRWTVDELLSGRAETGGDPDKEKWVARVRKRMKPALLIAERLIDEGFDETLEDGLAMELGYLEEIFHTPEARQGLGSVLG